jgi:ABC-2 type transport system ATP-binding protein
MLEVRNISFAWGDAPLLDDVTFSVAPGEVAALVGANGAGKTTLMKILAGVILPSAGTVLADGSDTFASPLRYHRLMGYLPENCPAEPDMSVRQYLDYRARLKGEMAKKIRHRVQEAISLCGLGRQMDERIGRLSFGLRKRVALADALLLRPRFLLLDDLLAGLDAATRASLGRILASVTMFAAVVVSGHELDELETVAGKFLVLKDGRMFGAKTAAGVKTLLLPPAEKRGEGGAK